MSWTKRQLIVAAYDELGIGASFGLTQDEQLSALYQLDAMMAQWDGIGLRLGYKLPSGQADTDLDQESGIPDIAIEAVYLGLAKRRATGLGKALPPSTATAARDAYAHLLARAVAPTGPQPGRAMPYGAGDRAYEWRRFTSEARDPLPVVNGGLVGGGT